MIPNGRMRFSSILLFLLVFMLAWRPAGPALADMAPPAQPPGSNFEPGEDITQVRMLAETVTIEVLADYGPESLGSARVNADFTMRNLGNQPETMAARFPISASDGYYNYPEVRDLRISVDGRSVTHRRISGEDPRTWGDKTVPWAEFDISFPTEKDVNVQVTYTLDGTGYFPFISYEYLLSTGAGWKDTIGSAEIILRYPYEASYLNTVFDEYGTPEPLQISGNEIHWSFNDLEPTPEDNMQFNIVAPAAWNKAIVERERVTMNPNDGEAWGRLGKAYKDILFYNKGMRDDPGSSKVYDLSVQAYDRCVELLPEDSLWHAGFAQLFYNYYFWEGGLQDNYHSSFFQAMEHANRALQIDPNNNLAWDIAQGLVVDGPDGAVIRQPDGTFLFAYLTATPAQLPQPKSPAASATPTGSTRPTTTPDVDEPSPAKPDDTPGTSPLCGATALALPALALLMSRSKSRRSNEESMS